MTGSARYAPGQTEAAALADLRRVLDAIEVEMPGLRADLRIDEG
jgi:acetylornithine deacetylase